MNKQFKVVSVPLTGGVWRSQVLTDDWRCIFTTYSGTSAGGLAECEDVMGRYRQRTGTAETLGLDAVVVT